MGLREWEVSAENGRATAWPIPIVIIGLSVLVAFGGDLAREALRYDRVWIAQGETWRFLSAHFAHLGWSHLALNSAGLLLVWFLVGANHDTRGWVIITFISMATMVSAFLFLKPELYWYVGMSGLVHGILAAGLLPKLARPDIESGVLGLLLLAKIGWEQLSGPLPGSEATSGGPVIVDAHLYGALGGLLGGVLAGIRVKARPPI